MLQKTSTYHGKNTPWLPAIPLPFNHLQPYFSTLQPSSTHLIPFKKHSKIGDQLLLSYGFYMFPWFLPFFLTSTSSYPPPAATPRRQRTQRRTKDQAKRRCSGAASGGGGRERLRSSGMPWAVEDRRIQKMDGFNWYSNHP